MVEVKDRSKARKKKKVIEKFKAENKGNGTARCKA